MQINNISKYQNEEQPPEILTFLLYKYTTGLAKLTGDSKYGYQDVVKKLTGILGKIRFGEWKSNDNNLKYDNMSVTDVNYRKTKGKKFGAQAIIYIEKDQLQKAVIAYDNTQGEGINLDSLDDLMHTFFHEWTHVMELDKLNENSNERVQILNREYSNNIEMENGEVWGTGLSTREYGQNADNYAENEDEHGKKRIMHNQITEGMVELIARKVMVNAIGQEQAEKVIDKARYFPHTKVAQAIMDGLGEEEVIKLFITHSQELVMKLESMQIEDRDALHYMSDFINDQNYEQLIPQYSNRTRFFQENMGILEQIYGIPEQNKEGLKKEFGLSEFEGTAISNFQNIFSKYGTKKLSDTELEQFNKILEEYKSLVNSENEFYDSLSERLKISLKQSDKERSQTKSKQELVQEAITGTPDLSILDDIEQAKERQHRAIINEKEEQENSQNK